MSVAPELQRERDHLDRARAELARMRERTLSLEAQGGDRISSEFLAATLYHRAPSLVDDPTSTLFFGRIDRRTTRTGQPAPYPRVAARRRGMERYYIGRRHVADDAGDPVVIDWRAEVSTAFYRASRAEPMGVRLRRRFGVDHGQITAYEDEHLTDPVEADRRQPDPGRRDRAPARRADARHRGHHPARAGRDRAGRRGHHGLRPGRAGHRQDRGRPAPRGVAALRLPRPAGPQRRAGRRPEPRLPGARRRGAAGAGRDRGRHATVEDLLAHGPGPRRRPRGDRWLKGDARMAEVLRRAVWSHVREPRPRPWSCRAGRGAGGCRRTRCARSWTSCAPAASGTTPRGRCCRTGWRTRCCCRWRQAGDSPDDRVQDTVARSPRGASRTSTPCGRRWTPAPCCSSCSSDPDALAARADGLLDEDEQRRLLWTTPPRPVAAPGGRPPTPSCVDEVARPARPAPRASATSCSTRRRTCRRCSCGPSGAAARPGR